MISSRTIDDSEWSFVICASQVADPDYQNNGLGCFDAEVLGIYPLELSLSDFFSRSSAV